MSSNGTYQGPIPTKISNLNSQYGCTCVTKVAPLEELVDDCFKYSIDQLNDPHKADVVKRFARYIVEAHCHENLSFLIEIFKYEYYFDKIINRTEKSKTTTRGNENCYLNLSLGRSIGDLPYPTKRTEPMFARKKSSAGVSVRSEDHEPMSVFVSTIDDLEEAPQGSEMNNVWDNLMEKNVGGSDTENDSDDEGEEEKSVRSIQSEENLIADQWDLVMDRYVHHNSPEQINLSNLSYKKILEEDRIANIFHSPQVLLPAKNEVLRLLEENVYHLFVNSYKEKDSTTASPLIQPRRVHESPSSLSIDDCDKSTNDDCNKTRLITKSEFDNVSPILTPTNSNVPKLFHKMNKSRLLHLSSSTNNLPVDSGSNSSSSSASSLSNILDHLRLNTNHVSSPLNASPIQTPNQSQPQSLSTSPLYLKEDKLSKFGKIWRSKKST